MPIEFRRPAATSSRARQLHARVRAHRRRPVRRHTHESGGWTGLTPEPEPPHPRCRPRRRAPQCRHRSSRECTHEQTDFRPSPSTLLERNGLGSVRANDIGFSCGAAAAGPDQRSHRTADTPDGRCCFRYHGTATRARPPCGGTAQPTPPDPSRRPRRQLQPGVRARR